MVINFSQHSNLGSHLLCLMVMFDVLKLDVVGGGGVVSGEWYGEGDKSEWRARETSNST